MKLTKYLLIAFTVFFSLATYAQGTYEVKGTVKSGADDFPIPGVSVIIQGTTKGAETDFDGNYSLQVKKGDVLDFTSLGYASQSVSVTGQKTINLTLQEDSETLEEVVVVGYGKRKKSHLTGSIAKVGGDDVAGIQAARVDDALAGKLSGVRITNGNGEPGAAPNIQIRAASTISQNSNDATILSTPLIVVNGFPISGDLSSISPNDIESIEVLKDAASAAIYGSRGANGVILVTTKKGTAGKTSFSYNTYTSVSNKYIDNILPTGKEWAETVERNIADGTFDNAEFEGLNPGLTDLRLDFFKNSPGQVGVEDWLFQSGVSTSHEFNMSGGNDDTRYFASVGYLDTEGVVRTQEYQRYNFRLSVDSSLGDKFKAGISANGYYSDRAQLAHNMRDLLRAYSVHPIIHTDESIAYVQNLDQRAQDFGLAAFDGGFGGSNADSTTELNSSIYTLEAGDYAHDWHYGGRTGLWAGSSNQGPAAKLFERENTTKEYYINGSGYLQYQIIDGLDLKTTLGADSRVIDTYNHQLSAADRRGEISRTILNERSLRDSKILSETTLSFSKQLGKDGKHDIAAVAGMEFQNRYLTGIRVNATNLAADSPLNYNLISPEDITVTETDRVETRRSVFGRINYAYDDRYLFSASIRRDGDSRFGVNNRFETFPAVSLGWNVHKEAFWNVDAISKFKVRASTGSLGTTAFLGSYNSLSLLNPQQTANGTAFLIPNDAQNDELTWQSNTERNYGIDLGFVNNRFTFSVDYYTSDIEDMLLDAATSQIAGTPSTKRNTGDLRSSGWEFEMSAGIIKNDNFSWNASANLSLVDTEITALSDNQTSLPDEQFGVSGRGPFFRNYIGGEIGEIWAIETIGQVEDSFILDPSQSPNLNSGESYVVDQNGDGVIDATKSVEEGGDLIKVGTNTPDFYWGMSHNFKYKNFDMSMQWQGSHGAEVYNLDPLYYNSQWGGRLRDSFDADDNGIADHNGQHYARNRDQLDTTVQDASFVALRNLTIGYTFDSGIVEKVGLGSVRLYGAATNLLYFTSNDYTSYNPEGVRTQSDGGDIYKGAITHGTQLGSSPTVRSFTIGLNLNF